MFTRFIIGAIGIGIIVGLMLPVSSPPPEPPKVALVMPSAAPSAPREASSEQTITRSADGHFYVDAEVNGQLVHFLIDTGASSVVLRMSDAKHVGLPFSADQFSVIARGASGNVRGQILKIGRVAIGEKEAFDVQAAVVDEGLDVSLLGQSFLSRISTVVIEGDRMILR
jgi:aspartyl protease family protein